MFRLSSVRCPRLRQVKLQAVRHDDVGFDHVAVHEDMLSEPIVVQDADAQSRRNSAPLVRDFLEEFHVAPQTARATATCNQSHRSSCSSVADATFDLERLLEEVSPLISSSDR